MDMRALVVTHPGGGDVLTVEDHPIPEPGRGEVVIKVAAVGVNFIDVYQREGAYPVHTPFILGNEGAGTVTAVGPEVTEVTEGDRVAWAMSIGAAAEYALVPASRLVPVPDDVPLETAAAVILQGLTADYLVHTTYPVSEGVSTLVHAAAGGVGQLLVQMITRLGGTVMATAGTPAKRELALSLGASAALDYADYDTASELAAAVRESNGGRGVDVVYDGVGAATFDASLASLRPLGMMVLFGASSGAVPPFDLQRLNSGGSLFVTRPSLGHYVASRDDLLARSDRVLSAVADGTLQVSVGGQYYFEDAAQAYADLEGRRSSGKLLLLP
ncbi:quinone oxidoreductase [Janibacter sp. GXQ6167]|uniref:quinone oxidoreductase family protein n=1 Tax=Janibacter sp. GXQ6167 TaxID=3240791 RepID=UPI0035246F1A